MDCGNATLAGITGQLMAKLQSVIHAATRLIFKPRKFDRVTLLLCKLHWLRYLHRVDFKLDMLVFWCLHGLVPAFLVDEFNRVLDIVGRKRLQPPSIPTTLFHEFFVQHSVTAHFRFRPHEYGTVCRSINSVPPHRPISETALRPKCSCEIIAKIGTNHATACGTHCLIYCITFLVVSRTLCLVVITYISVAGR